MSDQSWLEAKDGEAWVLTLDGWNEQAGVVVNGGDKFVMRDGGQLPKTFRGITAGRKIWPEDAS